MNKRKPIDLYLSKQTQFIVNKIEVNRCPDIVVAIPCYNENNISKSIHSLLANDVEQIYTHIIVVVNHSENSSPEIVEANYKTVKELEAIKDSISVSNFSLEIIKAFDLPHKKAGVGLARKIGMDHACAIFNYFDQDGIISCFDADSLCLKNYLRTLFHTFENNPKVDGISIQFEHPKSGDEYEEDIYLAIDQYEKHLNYYIDIQKFINLPFAFHTVGSSMAVRAISYAKFGGMNIKKAGEDFYFLQKFIENGTVIECNDTKVIPSPRISDRVPFGTGKAVGDLTNASSVIYYTYDPKSFMVLKELVDHINQLYFNDEPINNYELHPGLMKFLELINIESKIQEAKSNTTDLPGFRRRFFKHFNAFQLMKYVHFMRDHYFQNIPIDEAISQFSLIKSCSTTGNAN